MTVDFSRFQLAPDLSGIGQAMGAIAYKRSPEYQQKMRLAGLQERLLTAQAEEQEQDNERQQFVSSLAQSYTTMGDEINTINTLIADADESTIYNQLLQYLGQNEATLDPDDAQDATELARQAATDPAGVLQELRERQDALTTTRSRLRQNLSLLDPDNYGIEVQKTEILEDGTTISVLDDNTVTVRDAQGNEVTDPAERQKVINDAKQFKIELKGRETALKAAVDYSKTVYDNAGPVQQSIANLEEGVRLLDAGADTGPLMSRLPTLNENTLRLRQLNNRLGLDVVGQYTFGALSEKELRLAIETGAPPKNLNTAQTRRWFVDRMNAQKKVLRAIEEAAGYLGTGTRTIPDFIEYQRQQRKQQQSGGTSQTGRDPETGNLKATVRF